MPRLGIVFHVDINLSAGPWGCSPHPPGLIFAVPASSHGAILSRYPNQANQSENGGTRLPRKVAGVSRSGLDDPDRRTGRNCGGERADPLHLAFDQVAGRQRQACCCDHADVVSGCRRSGVDNDAIHKEPQGHR